MSRHPQRVYLFDKERYCVRTFQGVQRFGVWNESAKTFTCTYNGTNNSNRIIVPLDKVAAIADVADNGTAKRFHPLSGVYFGKFAPKKTGPAWIHPIRRRILPPEAVLVPTIEEDDA